MLHKYLGIGLLSALILISTGCGFKLQRSYSIPAELQELHLSSSDQYSELTRLLSDRLRINRVTLTDASPDTPTLRLERDSLERSTLSLYSTGNVAEYELIYIVNYSVIYPNQEPIWHQTEVRRDYQDDPRTALAKSREMELLTREMRVQAADLIIQKLASMGNQ